MAEAEIVMVTPYAKMTAEEFGLLQRCKAVVRYGVGYDNIDVAAANKVGVPVTIVPDTASEEVASHALAMGLALARRIPQGHAAIGAGQWAGTIGLDTPKLSNLQVGIVGTGRIGRLVATWWAAIGAKVHAFDPISTFEGVTAASLKQVLEESDVVSLHLPLTDETRHLISDEVLKRMRRNAVIVNVSRGGLIDEEALAAALTAGTIAGAGLDTFAHEPLPAAHPLREAPNTLFTPHVAWRSTTSLGALQEQAVERARRALQGEPLPDLVTR
ncbi:D-3-phosphoglycerate dehydrogenase [Rhizobium leguminosarum]|nr:D-3-phosphoglycerate dehydrogenase [Rhizobium leguminosarum]MBB4550514.1 D-3-phosphoglycerate dehydrogenase [Rhizobium leguminosarum]MBB4560776.1 D-3-phosphoglycerate dehydrogenase [Rhizobium leguminosarum]MBB4588696.1 D-3-phosphoglycerate dehydrogenase [Rhizobium leguminosarum]